MTEQALLLLLTTLTVGADGADVFITRAGDGSTVLAQADVITDFQDGTDLIGLDGVAFNELTIEQGSGACSADTIVKYGVEHLFVVQQMQSSQHD